MAAHPFILFAPEHPGASEWRVGTMGSGKPFIWEVTVPLQSDSDETAEQLAASLKQHGYDGRGIVLALGSLWCLAARFSTADLPRHDRNAMLFRLEEKLPWAAESLVADFIQFPADRALGVCVQTDSVRPLVESLEARQVTVQSITPTVLLAAQHVRGCLASAPQVILCREAHQVSLLTMRGQDLANWILLPDRPSDAKREWKIALMEMAPTARIAGLDLKPDDLAALGLGADADVLSMQDETVHTAATSAAGVVLSSRRPPWIELRQGALAAADPWRRQRKPLNALLASALLLALAFTFSNLTEAYRFNRQARSIQNQMGAEFSQAFPGWAPPASVKAIIESEHRKAQARAPTTLGPQMQSSALRTLQDLLGDVPGDLPITVDRLSVSDSGFELNGRLTSYGDLDRLAATARKAGLDVPPPQARKTSDGLWSFTLHGTRPTASIHGQGGV